MLYPFNDYSIILNLSVGLPAWVSKEKKKIKPNTAGQGVVTRRSRVDLACDPVFPGSFWPHLRSALSWRSIKCQPIPRMPRRPAHTFPSGRGSSLNLFAHGRGRELGLSCPVSEPYGAQDGVV